MKNETKTRKFFVRAVLCDVYLLTETAHPRSLLP